MYVLRTLGIRDVVRALKQRKLRAAFRITLHLISNVLNAAKFRLQRRTARRPS